MKKTANTRQVYATPLFFSLLFHGVVLVLFIGIESHQTIQIAPQVDEIKTIEASLVMSQPPPKLALKKAAPEPEPKPEPEIIPKNTVAMPVAPPIAPIEKKKPKTPDKKLELKRMAEQSLEQAFKQENLQEQLQENFQKKLQEHDLEFRQAAAPSPSEINEHMMRINRKVTQNWRKPIDIHAKSLACVILIKTVANGMITEVSVIESSGDLSFDRSAEMAVKKSSPLPMPTSALVRSEFKQFEFSFNPGV